MANDSAQVTDAALVSLETTVTPPAHGCAECGAETKAHHPVLDDDGEVVTERRICSARNCRTIVDL